VIVSVTLRYDVPKLKCQPEGEARVLTTFQPKDIMLYMFCYDQLLILKSKK